MFSIGTTSSISVVSKWQASYFWNVVLHIPVYFIIQRSSRYSWNKEGFVVFYCPVCKYKWITQKRSCSSNYRIRRVSKISIVNELLFSQRRIHQSKNSFITSIACIIHCYYYIHYPVDQCCRMLLKNVDPNFFFWSIVLEHTKTNCEVKYSQNPVNWSIQKLFI